MSASILSSTLQRLCIFPLFYIAVQMEDSSKADLFTEAYLQILQNASAILDYSTANIAFLTQGPRSTPNFLSSPGWLPGQC